MLYVLAGILLLAWLLGFGVFHVASSLIHIVLVLAIISAVIALFRGRTVV